MLISGVRNGLPERRSTPVHRERGTASVRDHGGELRYTRVAKERVRGVYTMMIFFFQKNLKIKFRSFLQICLFVFFFFLSRFSRENLLHVSRRTVAAQRFIRVRYPSADVRRRSSMRAVPIPKRY